MNSRRITAGATAALLSDFGIFPVALAASVNFIRISARNKLVKLRPSKSGFRPESYGKLVDSTGKAIRYLDEKDYKIEEERLKKQGETVEEADTADEAEAKQKPTPSATPESEDGDENKPSWLKDGALDSSNEEMMKTHGFVRKKIVNFDDDLEFIDVTNGKEYRYGDLEDSVKQALQDRNNKGLIWHAPDWSGSQTESKPSSSPSKPSTQQTPAVPVSPVPAAPVAPKVTPKRKSPAKNKQAPAVPAPTPATNTPAAIPVVPSVPTVVPVKTVVPAAPAQPPAAPPAISPPQVWSQPMVTPAEQISRHPPVPFPTVPIVKPITPPVVVPRRVKQIPKAASSIVERVLYAHLIDRVAFRGQQVRRKDKDTMRDTGGVSKGRESEPFVKPPRDDLKKRFRKKDKPAGDRDPDVDNSPDNRSD